MTIHLNPHLSSGQFHGEGPTGFQKDPLKDGVQGLPEDAGRGRLKDASPHTTKMAPSPDSVNAPYVAKGAKGALAEVIKRRS